MTNARTNIILAIASSLVMIFADRATKVMADLWLAGSGTIHVVGDFFILIYAKNRGAFLSMGHELNNTIWTILFIILPLIFIFILTFHIFQKYRTQRLIMMLWALFFSGGAGNIIDRILYGKVTDFMNLGIGDTIRTGIFNVADLYIVIALIIVLFTGLGNTSAGTTPKEGQK